MTVRRSPLAILLAILMSLFFVMPAAASEGATRTTTTFEDQRISGKTTFPCTGERALLTMTRSGSRTVLENGQTTHIRFIADGVASYLLADGTLVSGTFQANLVHNYTAAAAPAETRRSSLAVFRGEYQGRTIQIFLNSHYVVTPDGEVLFSVQRMHCAPPPR